jgi:small ligand-binding sensory domain FIST
MPFVNALSQHPEPAEATGDVVGRVTEALDAVPDLAVLFCSADHADALDDIVATIRALLSPRVLIGATAESVVGGEYEVEEGPALTLWAASLPSVPTPVRVTAIRTPTGTAIQGLAVADLPPGGTLLLLADPFSLPVDAILDAVEASGTGVMVAGGMASAARAAGGNRLVLDSDVVTHGGVGVVLPPEAAVSTVVSQGCRPVGRPMIVTRGRGNVLDQLAGKPALERLEELAQRAGPEERSLLASGLHLGVAIDEHRDAFGRGDFLIRGVVGVERSTGGLVVGDEVDVGTTVQFHVRDADAADEDLHAMLAPTTGDAALLFTCNGRGSRLFGEPDHDARAVRDALGTDAVAGMACAGEVGPVGHRSFLHGFTASVVVFQDSLNTL